MEKTLELPLIEGDETPAAVERVADGPEPLAPAQAAQLCQPDILWICDFTVWADERTEAKHITNRAITKIDRVLFSTIATFTPGDVFCFEPHVPSDEAGDY
jgi:hypothetical protein